MELDSEGVDFESEEENLELTTSELFAAIIMNGEVVITIPSEEVERIKTGLKNLKAKQAAKMKEDGLVPDPSTLSFVERPTEDPLFVDLSISLTRKSVIKILKMRIPDNEL